MKLGDKVMTPEGKGILGDLHRFNTKRDHFQNDVSYVMYAVRMLNTGNVRYFLPNELKKIRIEYSEDRLTGTLEEMEIVEDG